MTVSWNVNQIKMDYDVVDGLFEMMVGSDNVWELAEQMIEWIINSRWIVGQWLRMDDNGCQIMSDGSSLYRWRS